MDILKKLDLTLPQLLKAVGIVILALLLLIFVSSFFNAGFDLNTARDKSVSSMPSMGVGAPQYYAEETNDVALSSRNVIGESLPISPVDGNGFTPGANAEDFEVKEYQGTIETQNSERDCVRISDLKIREDVIFERASEHDEGCSYTFKVENQSVSEVLSVIENLNPKELTERSYTIKRQVDDYTGEIEILETKLENINATLESAITQYDNITSLATRIADVESLAKIIESKLNIIERLTGEKMRTTASLERIARQKADQLDRLNYTYFYISIYENKYINADALKDSWKRATQQFVFEINEAVQDLSVGLIALLFVIFKYLIYFVIVLFVVRFLWEFTKKVFRQSNPKRTGGEQHDIE